MPSGKTTKSTDIAAPRSNHKQPPIQETQSTERPTHDTKSSTTTTLPFNVPNEVLNLSATEEFGKKFAKRELVNNWEKYEKEIVEIDNEQLNAADFEKLLAAPSSIGGHFFFSSEKSWQTDDNTGTAAAAIVSPLAAKYFNLNIQELTKNLQRLPFYVRQEYPKDLFTDKEIEEMNRKANLFDHQSKTPAEEINAKMRALIEQVEEKPSKIAKPTILKEPEKKVQPMTKSQEVVSECFQSIGEVSSTIVAQPVNPNDSDDELDALLGLSLKPNSTNINLTAAVIVQPSGPDVVENVAVSNDGNASTTFVPKVGENKEEIQKWLDDIFD